MGKISFDRCTRILRHIRSNIKPMIESDVETQDEALERALEIMCKYQKIKEILNDDSYYEDYGSKAEFFMVAAICEEVKDGNDD